MTIKDEPSRLLTVASGGREDLHEAIAFSLIAVHVVGGRDVGAGYNAL